MAEIKYVKNAMIDDPWAVYIGTAQNCGVLKTAKRAIETALRRA
jgi:hypothetical protein